MAKQKQRIDGRISRSFTVNGKRHFIYGRSKQELDRKEYEKRQKLEAGQERRDDPTFANQTNTKIILPCLFTLCGLCVIIYNK